MNERTKVIVLGLTIIAGSLIGTVLWAILLYDILVIVNASHGMWVLYWIYAPVTIVITALVQHFRKLVYK